MEIYATISYPLIDLFVNFHQSFFSAQSTLCWLSSTTLTWSSCRQARSTATIIKNDKNHISKSMRCCCVFFIFIPLLTKQEQRVTRTISPLALSTYCHCEQILASYQEFRQKIILKCLIINHRGLRRENLLAFTATRLTLNDDGDWVTMMMLV